MQSKRKKQRNLHQIKETDETNSTKSKESANSGVETEQAMFLAVLQQNDLNRYPERGILKNGPVRVNSELEPSAEQHRLLSDGYESEPAYPTFRVFENSIRKLNECDPYRRRSKNNDNQDATYVSYAGSAASAPISRRIGVVRSGYCTDEDRNLNLPRYVDSSPDGPVSTPPPPPQKIIVSSLRSSPTDSGRSLGQAQPLKLKNIEFLLKQLDRKSNTSLSPTSSTELSVPEAENMADDCLLEESSNTESHRDGQYAVKRDFPEIGAGGGVGGSTIHPPLMSSAATTNNHSVMWRPTKLLDDFGGGETSGSRNLSSKLDNSHSGGLLVAKQHHIVPRLNLINNSQNNICASCQLPTPEHYCCGVDGRISSDGSCDNNVCVCKSVIIQHMV